MSRRTMNIKRRPTPVNKIHSIVSPSLSGLFSLVISPSRPAIEEEEAQQMFSVTDNQEGCRASSVGVSLVFTSRVKVFAIDDIADSISLSDPVRSGVTLISSDIPSGSYDSPGSDFLTSFSDSRE
jgi:hypothetical protein